MSVLELAPARAIDSLERDLGLTDEDLAHGLGISSRSLARWRTGATYPQREARQRLAQLIELERHLRDTFTTSEAVRAWLNTESRYLGGLLPLDAIRVGRFDRVEATLEALDSGIFI